MRTSNLAQLSECTAALEERQPNDPTAVSYAWALAMQRGDLDAAERLLARASEFGVAPPALEGMAATTRAGKTRSAWRRGGALAAAALLLVALILVAWPRLRGAAVPASRAG